MTCNIFEATVSDFKLDLADPQQFDSTFQYYFLKVSRLLIDLDENA